MLSVGRKRSSDEKDSGIFIFDEESITMRKWQILEFDGKPYYVFVPVNETPLDSILPEETENDFQKDYDGLEMSDVHEMKLESIRNDLFNYSSNEENFCEDFEEVAEAIEEFEDMKIVSSQAAEKHSNDRRKYKLLQEKMGVSKVVFQKLDSNILNLKTENIESSEAKESVEDTIEDIDEGGSLEEDFKKLQESPEALILKNCTLRCRLCSETFSSTIQFKKHVAWTHKKKIYIKENATYMCCICDYKTIKKNLFAAHLQRKHETLTSKKQNVVVFPCEACGFECRSKHSLQSHFIRKHTDRYEHQCKFCPKKFKVKGDLTNHIRFHHKEKPVNCDVCGKLCLNSGSLYVHQKWAHYKPKFECPICKRRMVTQENLDQHMVSQHEKREKIVCAECGKTFTKKDSFKRHMAVHTGNKPHSCLICHKPFARRSQLRQHLLIHTGKRPFVCDICGKAFTQKPGLICHRKIHPGPHPPLPVMPIGDIVKEFTDSYIAEVENENPENE